MNDHTRPQPGMKGRFPFRLGTTSYIIPADILPNVEFLASRVDDVELVLFESDEFSNLPDEDTIRQLTDGQRKAALSYTVHFPLDADLGSADEAERSRSVDKCLRVAALTRPLNPLACIVHFNGDVRGPRPSADVGRWQDALDRSVAGLLASGIEPRDLCAETLDYAFDLVEPIVLKHNLAVCADVGHMLLNGHSVDAFLDRHADRCRVIHLHGIREGKDHADISSLGSGIIGRAVEAMGIASDRERALTLEVFNRDDFETSLAILEDYAP